MERDLKHVIQAFLTCSDSYTIINFDQAIYNSVGEKINNQYSYCYTSYEYLKMAAHKNYFTIVVERYLNHLPICNVYNELNGCANPCLTFDIHYDIDTSYFHEYPSFDNKDYIPFIEYIVNCSQILSQVSPYLNNLKPLYLPTFD